MFRFTIRDVLCLTAVVALSVALWANHQRYRRQLETMAEEAMQLKKESKVWESRARSLRDDMTTGTNNNTEIEFVPGGIRYIAKKSNKVLEQKPEPQPPPAPNRDPFSPR